MIYNYACSNKKCGNVQEGEALVRDFRIFHPKCEKCGKKCNYKFIPSVIHFAMKDGPSGIAPSKAIRVNGQHQKKYEELGRRQQDRYGHLRRDVVPNYKGQDTESWTESRSLAMKESGPEAAATYNKKIAEEKMKKVSLK